MRRYGSIEETFLLKKTGGNKKKYTEINDVTSDKRLCRRKCSKHSAGEEPGVVYANMENEKMEVYFENRVSLKGGVVTAGRDLSDFTEDVEWGVHGMPAMQNVMSYGHCSEPYPNVTFTLLLKRTPFYIVNLLVLCILLSFLAPLSFYPSAAFGEKVSRVTVLLAVSAFQLKVVEIMMNSGNAPLVGKYYIAMMALITASTALTIMVMNIHFCRAEAWPEPLWARAVILKYTSRILFVYDMGEICLSPCSDQEQDHLMKVYDKLPEPDLKTAGNKCLPRRKERNKLMDTGHGGGLTNDLGYQGENLQHADSYCVWYEVLIRNIKYIAKCLKDHKATNCKGSEWKKFAKVIDQLFTLIFFLVVFVMTILIIARAD
ncbi:LOW QUALITY PROTEIN: neuronal acetylcholine receptor subunit alpha-9-like [Glossophaga mutica]